MQKLTPSSRSSSRIESGTTLFRETPMRSAKCTRTRLTPARRASSSEISALRSSVAAIVRSLRLGFALVTVWSARLYGRRQAFVDQVGLSIDLRERNGAELGRRASHRQ